MRARTCYIPAVKLRRATTRRSLEINWYAGMRYVANGFDDCIDAWCAFRKVFYRSNGSTLYRGKRRNATRESRAAVAVVRVVVGEKSGNFQLYRRKRNKRGMDDNNVEHDRLLLAQIFISRHAFSLRGKKGKFRVGVAASSYWNRCRISLIKR